MLSKENYGRYLSNIKRDNVVLPLSFTMLLQCPFLQAQVLPISVTLAICFLSCICTGEDVDPLDISQLALNGDIPYLGFFDDTFQASKELQKIVSRSFILPNGKEDEQHFLTVKLDRVKHWYLTC